MEIANYERSIKSLNIQLLNKEKEINETKSELTVANESMAKLKIDADQLLKEKESLEEKCTKMKQLLVKAKKDVSDAKMQEVQQLSNDVQLKSQIESCNIEIENYKVNN